jgi:hypothetical protein
MTLKVNVAVLCQDIVKAARPHWVKMFSVPTIIDGKTAYGESPS